jgi:hypothetical protein
MAYQDPKSCPYDLAKDKKLMLADAAAYRRLEAWTMGIVDAEGRALTMQGFISRYLLSVAERLEALSARGGKPRGGKPWR